MENSVIIREVKLVNKPPKKGVIITAGLKTSKKAAERNHAKRRIRSIVYPMLKTQKPKNPILIQATKSTTIVPYPELTKEIKSKLSRLLTNK